MRKRRIAWRSLLTALTSSTVVGAVAVLAGPKAGAAAGALAFLVQSQLPAVVRRRRRATDTRTDGQRVQSTLTEPS